VKLRSPKSLHQFVRYILVGGLNTVSGIVFLRSSIG
jgi:putative flippase GtrA